jgi:protein AroM
LITIGQSPRDDIVPDMMAQVGFDVEPIQVGAIDGLTLDEVLELAPQDGEEWAVSRMQDGTEVRLAKRELVPRMQQRINELQELGVDLIVPLCASNWKALRSEVPFINPGGALPAIVTAMCRPGGTLGVISPTADQARMAPDRYRDAGMPVISTYAQPYTDEDEKLRQCEEAGRLMARPEVGLVYMGCMGHSREMRKVVREVSGRPTVTSNSIIAGLIAQALS